MEIKEEFEQFLEDIKTDRDSFIYLDESDLEFDYSHCEIYEAHDNLEFEIKEYLHKNLPGKWAVWSDWAVHVYRAERIEDNKRLNGYIIN